MNDAGTDQNAPPAPQPTPGGGAPADGGARRPSVAATVLIVGAVIVALAGVVFAAIGVGGSNPIEISFGEDFKLKTASIGFAMIFIGLLAAVRALTELPAGVGVFSGASDTGDDRRTPALLAGATVAFIAAVVALIVDH